MPSSVRMVSPNVLEGTRDAEHEVTVGGLAELLGVDPSVASRMVTDTIKAGYLFRAPSQHDGRRTVLHLGPAGGALMAHVRRRRRAAFERIAADWDERERPKPARLVLKCVASLGRLHVGRQFGV
ncbi:MarR family winged helix-turn-helix transcriptional regulator [Kitasatospora sp. NPDC059795]|uniref:MarR family winged helix-turn-helix transcriptional regulator n=1 Tax=Kitasatospora sp. NPDC059795 TaxID=3346949 RepID=UPI0036497C40